MAIFARIDNKRSAFMTKSEKAGTFAAVNVRPIQNRKISVEVSTLFDANGDFVSESIFGFKYKKNGAGMIHAIIY